MLARPDAVDLWRFASANAVTKLHLGMTSKALVTINITEASPYSRV
jgi:hypothetical protein